MTVGRTVAAVIRREYVERVRTKAFVVATLGFPLLVLALALVPGLFMARAVHGEADLLVDDRTGLLSDALVPLLRDLGFQVAPAEGLEREEELWDRVASGAHDAVLILDDETISRGRAVYLGERAPSTLRRFGLRQAVVQAALELRLAEGPDGADVRALLAGGELEVRLPDGEDRDRARQTAGLVLGGGGAFVLYFVLLVYGAIILRSVMEEKTGRIVEILLSSLRPWELMLGKIVGIGAVGLTQLTAWGTVALLLLVLGAPALAEAGLPVPGELPDLALAIPDQAVVVYFVLSFVLGYLLYASLFAAVGAVCSSEEEAQQAQLPVILLIVAPAVFLLPVIEEPGTTLARSLSLVPFFSPILMFARVAVGGAVLWEIVLSVVLMVAAVGLAAVVAGKIYRTGVLMQGKRPSLRELWRWIRA